MNCCMIGRTGKGAYDVQAQHIHAAHRDGGGGCGSKTNHFMSSTTTTAPIHSHCMLGLRGGGGGVGATFAVQWVLQWLCSAYMMSCTLNNRLEYNGGLVVILSGLYSSLYLLSLSLSLSLSISLLPLLPPMQPPQKAYQNFYLNCICKVVVFKRRC